MFARFAIKKQQLQMESCKLLKKTCVMTCVDVRLSMAQIVKKIVSRDWKGLQMFSLNRFEV
jgi:hypothetical protein